VEHVSYGHGGVCVKSKSTCLNIESTTLRAMRNALSKSRNQRTDLWHMMTESRSVDANVDFVQFVDLVDFDF